MVSVEDFDPNQDFQVNPWLVYDGKPHLYRSRGPALNRFMGVWGAAKLCESVDGRWVTHAYKPSRNLDFGVCPCDVCGGRPLEAIHSHRQQYKRGPNAGPLYAHGHWVWERDGSKITSPPKLLFLCYACKRTLGL